MPRLIPSYLLAGAALAVLLAGFIALVEMTYHLESAEELGTQFALFGLPVEVGATQPWVLATVVFVLGLGLFLATLRLVRRAWAQVNAALQATEAQA